MGKEKFLSKCTNSLRIVMNTSHLLTVVIRRYISLVVMAINLIRRVQISTLQAFNFDEPVPKEFINRLVEYFNFRWNNYKHFCFTGEFENVTI